MNIPTKNGDVEVEQSWIDEWSELYYDVPKTIADARIWCLDNPQKQKTRRGLRAFLGSWIRRSCTKKPVAQAAKRPEVFTPPESLEVRKSRIAELKAVLK